MERHELDFHSTFRTLVSFSPSSFLAGLAVGDADYRDKVVSLMLPHLPTSTASSSVAPTQIDPEMQKREIVEWLEVYARRALDEKQHWLAPSPNDVNSDIWEKARSDSMKYANPRFVLRQWVLEEVIKRCGEDSIAGRRILAKVMEVRNRPFPGHHWALSYTLLDGHPSIRKLGGRI